MSVSPAPSVAPPGKTPDPAEGRAEELRGAAEAFEAIYVQTLIQRMRDAQLEQGFFGKSAGSSVYEGMFEQYLAENLSETSPLGIAEILMRQWTEGREGVEPPREAMDRLEALRAHRTYEAAVTGTGGGAPAGEFPASRSGPAAVATPPVRPSTPESVPAERAERAEKAKYDSVVVSRPFGWGRDPIDGSRRFHAGVDLAAPAGMPVTSVAPGRIESIGRTPGYGLHVVLRHADGWTTCYAHLSEADVREGQWLPRGRALGRVGDTGRSTGPHLHFEARHHGEPVDPAVAAPGPLRPQVLGRPADKNREVSAAIANRTADPREG